MPFGGKFRIIDFTLSNCVNSGIRRIGICTQYKAQSLIRHVQRGWSFLDGRFDEFVELLPAQQRIAVDWYRGTADAVYQNLDILRRHEPDYVLILAGDHVYKMDYGKMLAEHVWRAARHVDRLRRGAGRRCPRAWAWCRSTPPGASSGSRRNRRSPRRMPGRPGHGAREHGHLRVQCGVSLRGAAPAMRSDRRLEPRFRQRHHPAAGGEGAAVYAHRFSDSCVNMVEGVPYWRDVGTIDAYWEANIELTKVVPDLNLYDHDWPIWTYQEQLPPAKFVFDEEERRGMAVDSMVSGGDIISGATVRRSVLFSNVTRASTAASRIRWCCPTWTVGRRRHVEARGR